MERNRSGHLHLDLLARFGSIGMQLSMRRYAAAVMVEAS
jgi:hypothetical protein